MWCPWGRGLCCAKCSRTASFVVAWNTAFPCRRWASGWKRPEPSQRVTGWDKRERSNLMQHRIAFDKAAPEGVKAMWAMENYVRHCGLEPSLLELVKFRASQINGCAYCIDMHTKDARAHGETEQRLYALSAWRETPF